MICRFKIFHNERGAALTHIFMKLIDEKTKAAIIGHWRGGATLEQIIVATYILYWKVKEIIDEYKELNVSKG